MPPVHTVHCLPSSCVSNMHTTTESQEPLDATQPMTLTDVLLEHAGTLQAAAVSELPMPGSARPPAEEEARFAVELCRDYHPSCSNWAKSV